MKNKKGFTLVELLVVITIMGIITVLALPGVQQLQARNRTKKFEAYSSRLQDAGKLYVDAYSDDMFGTSGNGCYDISYQDLYAKSLIKNYATEGISCDDEKTFVHVERNSGKYKYDVSLYCVKDGSVVYNNVVSKCGDSIMTALPTIHFSYTNNGGSNDWSKSKSVTITITASEGLNANVSIKYGWTAERGTVPASLKEYNFKNDYGETELTYKIDVADLDGEYYFFVDGDNIVDIRGRFAQDFYSDEKLKFDKIAPTTPILNNSYNGVWAGQDYVNANKYVIGVTSSDNASGIKYYQYRYPNSENVWHTYTSSSGNNFTTSPFTNERNEIVEIRACDYAENCSNAAQSTIMIDKTAPTCTIAKSGTTGNNGWYKSTDVTLNMTYNDAGGSNINGYNLTTSTTASYTGTSTTAVQGDTSASGIVWYGYVKDTAGNTAVCNSGNFKVDKSAPTCTSSGGSTTWSKAAITITGTCTDNGNSGCTGNATKKYSTNTNTTTASPGTVTDNAGNSTTCPANQTVKVDVSAPTCTISKSGTSGDNGWYKSDVVVTIANSDTGGSGVSSYGLTTSTTASYSSTSTTATQSTTAGTIWYGYVKDSAGNVGSCNSGTIKVDKTVPSCSVAVTSGTTNSSGNYTTNVTVSLTRSDATSGVASYGMNTSSTVSYNSTTSLTASSNGSYTYYGFVKDNAGNTKSCNISFTISKYSCSSGTLTYDSSKGYICVKSGSCSSGITGYTTVSCGSACSGCNDGICGPPNDGCWGGTTGKAYCSCPKFGTTCSCPSGWSTYSGSGSSLKCYKAAS